MIDTLAVFVAPHAIHSSQTADRQVTCCGGVGSVLAQAARGGRRRACRQIADDKFVNSSRNHVKKLFERKQKSRQVQSCLNIARSVFEARLKQMSQGKNHRLRRSRIRGCTACTLMRLEGAREGRQSEIATVTRARRMQRTSPHHSRPLLYESCRCSESGQSERTCTSANQHCSSHSIGWRLLNQSTKSPITDRVQATVPSAPRAGLGHLPWRSRFRAGTGCIRRP
jgi:hypothetical protein